MSKQPGSDKHFKSCGNIVGTNNKKQQLLVVVSFVIVWVLQFKQTNFKKLKLMLVDIWNNQFYAVHKMRILDWFKKIENFIL